MARALQLGIREPEVGTKFVEREKSIDDALRLLGVVDQETALHCTRVAYLSHAIGVALGLIDVRLGALRVGALLHDIGKGFIPSDILFKAEKLTTNEYRIVQDHADLGDQAVADWFTPTRFIIRDIVRHHHERLDGSGYPDGLSGEQISLEARIVSVADVFDALTCVRPYREALSHEQAICILQAEVAEGLLDEIVLRALCSMQPPSCGYACKRISACMNGRECLSRDR